MIVTWEELALKLKANNSVVIQVPLKRNLTLLDIEGVERKSIGALDAVAVELNGREISRVTVTENQLVAACIGVQT